MKKILFISTALLSVATSFAQLADFENPVLQNDTAWFGQDQVIDGDTTFLHNAYTFENSYNSAWGSFTGWSYSNVTDNTTPGPVNQFSNITGSGQGGSSQYAICYANGNTRLFGTVNGGLHGFTPDGAYFTNSTYAYFSMLNGDDFAKPFGSPTDANGNDDGTNGEDWFVLTIYGLGFDSLRTGDSVNFYLADYRFSDNTQDYIVDTWEWVDLSSLAGVYGLEFRLNSSDQGAWGMNTPAYFAMDNFQAEFSSIEENNHLTASTYPNPTTGSFVVEAPVGAQITVTDLSGRIIQQGINSQNISEWNIDGEANGIYIVNIQHQSSSVHLKIIKH